jgi:hypothetical protein
MIQGEMIATGARPTFAAEPYAMGLQEHIHLTGSLFARSGEAPAGEVP